MLKLNWAYIFGIATTLIVLAGFEEKPALAQNYPDKPIKILMPFGPGGAGDVYLRALAPELQSRLGQPVVVENKPGAFTLTGGQACAQSPPDGYTLCMLSIDTTSLS